jgi:hypothetical protein
MWRWCEAGLFFGPPVCSPAILQAKHLAVPTDSAALEARQAALQTILCVQMVASKRAMRPSQFATAQASCRS